MDKTAKSQRGFTLVEMLIAMAVIVTLIGLSAAGYYGLRTTMILKQSTENLRSDIMYAKRASMLIKRETSENWIKGVGVDLASMHGEDPRYRIFKWCSSDIIYEEFDEEGGTPFSSIITALPSEYYGTCESIGTSELVDVPAYGEISPVAKGLNFRIIPTQNIRFIVFESPTGKIHFYTCTGEEYVQQTSVSLIYQFNTRAYELEITTNGEVNVRSYDGEIPETNVCDGTINIFE